MSGRGMWVARRYSQSARSDEDAAMAFKSHLADDEKSARTMLVGMIVSEAFAWFRMTPDAAKFSALLEIARQVSEGSNRVESPTRGVFFEIRDNS